MKVTILDTVSRATVEAVGEAYYWTEGNGCCDCNRGMLVLGSDVWFPPYVASNTEACRGYKRFLIIKTDDPDYTVLELNEGYPQELLRAEGLIP